MAATAIDVTELRGEIQDFANSLALLVDIMASGIPLSERGQVGLLEFGHYSQQRIIAVEEKLRYYGEANDPS